MIIRKDNGQIKAITGPFLDGSRLGYAKLSNWAFENADGSAICIDMDYTGAQRHQVTFAGPFDCGTVSRIVWN